MIDSGEVKDVGVSSVSVVEDQVKRKMILIQVVPVFLRMTIYQAARVLG